MDGPDGVAQVVERQQPADLPRTSARSRPRAWRSRRPPRRRRARSLAHSSSSPGCVFTPTAIWLAIVPDGTNRAASLPSSSAVRASSTLDRRVVAEDVVADLRLGHRPAHRRALASSPCRTVSRWAVVASALPLTGRGWAAESLPSQDCRIGPALVAQPRRAPGSLSPPCENGGLSLSPPCEGGARGGGPGVINYSVFKVRGPVPAQSFTGFSKKSGDGPGTIHHPRTTLCRKRRCDSNPADPTPLRVRSNRPKAIRFFAGAWCVSIKDKDTHRKMTDFGFRACSRPKAAVHPRILEAWTRRRLSLGAKPSGKASRRPPRSASIKQKG